MRIGLCGAPCGSPCGTRADRGWTGTVSIIGAGINATYTNLRRGCACLRQKGIGWFALSTSLFRATWLVERADLDEAVRQLHAAFIEQSSPRVP